MSFISSMPSGSAALVVEQLVETAVTQDTPRIVMGLLGAPAHNLYALDVLKRVPADQIVGSWDEARETALELLGEKEAWGGQLLPIHHPVAVASLVGTACLPSSTLRPPGYARRRRMMPRLPMRTTSARPMSRARSQLENIPTESNSSG